MRDSLGRTGAAMRRIYSRRERFLFALMLPPALIAAAGGAYFAVTDSQSRLLGALAAFGGVGAFAVCIRIVVTGRASRAMEQDAVEALRGEPVPPED